MRFGVVVLGDSRWSEGGWRWKRAEELGFDHVWTYDHLAWRSLRDSSWMAAVPTLAAASLATCRIRLGTLVASANFRHPVPFAKELMTLDDLSNGRLFVGIGAGGTGWDATMLGQQPWTRRERQERFAEFVELTHRVLSAPATSFEGRYYLADEARNLPGCVQQPRVPFAIAATGPKAMRVAAVHGEAWVTTGDPSRGVEPLGAGEGAAAVRGQLDLLEKACEDIGRDPVGIGRMVLTGPQLDPGTGSAEQLRDFVGAYEESGVTDYVVHWPRPAPPYEDDFDRWAEIMSAVLGSARGD